MVNIVTGGINSGKTTKLLSLFNINETGDGFILPKVYVEGEYVGQRIIRLSTGESVLFSFKAIYMPENWNEKYRYNVYSFSQEGFAFASKIVEDIVTNCISPVYIDEIGPLELQEKGFFDLFTALLQKSDIIYVSVRDALLENVIKKFRIKEYQII